MFINASKKYNNDRKKYEVNFYDEIKNAEQAIINNPKTAGDQFEGNSYKRYRHIDITQDVRLWYVICEERRSLKNSKFQQMKKKDNIFEWICKFCSLICIEQPADNIMLLRIMSHSEQDRLVGGRRKW
jgi:mRNA-degrading endonuclease YafQ of YafQ-DinJ toxin-antitoxin module